MPIQDPMQFRVESPATAVAVLDESTPPLPGYESCAPPLRGRKAPSRCRRCSRKASNCQCRATKVHTHETNRRAELRKLLGEPEPTLTPKQIARREKRAEAKERRRIFADQLNQERRARGIIPAKKTGGIKPPPFGEPTENEKDFRHGATVEFRAMVSRVMGKVACSDNRRERYAGCGGKAFVQLNPTKGKVRLQANNCRDKMCPYCDAKKARKMAGNLADELERRMGVARAKGDAGFQFSHLVLTMKGNKLPVRLQRSLIVMAFNRLRSYNLGTVPRARNIRGQTVNWWDEHVDGGAYFIEEKLQASGLWHVHLHCIIEAEYIPGDDLKSLWMLATGSIHPAIKAGWKGAWIGRIDGYEGAAREVCKYATKSARDIVANADVWGINAEDKLMELMAAWAGAHSAMTIGNWRGTFTLTKKLPYDPDEWITVGSLDQVIARARAGDSRSQRLLEILRGEVSRTPRPPPLVSQN